MAAISGACSVWFVYDIGQSIDLDRCTQLLSGASRTGRLEVGHHAPSWFEFAPPPLRFSQPVPPLQVGRWRVTGDVALTVFDFGAVSLAYRIEVDGELPEWIELSCALASSDVLQRASLACVGELLRQIASAVTRPGVADVSEDYVVYHWRDLAADTNADELLARSGLDLARLLRADPGPLSAQEVADALATRVQFHDRDLLLVDWNAAVMFDDDPGDALRVLEFANVQLLELRFLDAQLDRALDRAHELLGRGTWRRRLALFGLHRDLDRVSTMQVDGAILFERVGNTLKLIGDQYLARVLRQTSQRFRSAEWNAAILRKLDTLDGIYEKVHDHSVALRAEFLEWIIILMIAFEIVWAVFGH